MTSISKFLYLGLFLTLLGKTDALAQFGLGAGQELGIVAGPIAFLSDYGQRNSFETNAGNTGMGIGLVYYLNFTYNKDCKCYSAKNYFSDHFKIRSGIDYHRTELNHYGEVAEPKGEVDKNTMENAGKLKAMSSIATLFELGANLEYHPLSIRDFSVFKNPLAPFISIGGNYVNYNPKTTSTMGSLEHPGNLYWKFQNGVDIKGKGGTTLSLVAGAGTRYKLSYSEDLLVNLQWRYYITDWIDGLNHNRPENRKNDSILWLNIGYIYYLNF